MVMVLLIYGLNKLGSHGWEQLSSLDKDKIIVAIKLEKHFAFYRKSAEQKNKLYNYGQIGILLTLLLMLITGNISGSVGYVVGTV